MKFFYRVERRIMIDGFIESCSYALSVLINGIAQCICDTYLDIRYSKRLLKGNLKSIYKHMGANDVYHTKYAVLPIIFRLVPIKKEDVLVDVGCGKGRVINYWLSRKCHNRIIGLELDPEVAMKTKKHLKKWKNVTILCGDAIKKLPEDGTLFYFYNPFSQEKVFEFEKVIYEMSKGRDIKIIYYNPKSIHVFQNGNWRLKYINFEKDLGIKRRGRLNKYHDLAIITNKAE